MKKTWKRTLVLMLALVSVLAVSIPTQAATTAKVKYGSATLQTASASRQAQIKAEVKEIFDASYYAAMYKDLRKEYGIGNVNKLTDKQKDQLWNHFWNGGIYEGRQCSAEFNVNAYFSAYGDLRATYGDDVVAYYVNYLEKAKTGAESRPCTTIKATQKAGFNIYTVVGYNKDSQWPFNKCGWVAGSQYIGREKAYGAGQCIGNGMATWYRAKPDISNDLAELKMGYEERTGTFYKTDVKYTTGGSGYFLAGTNTYKIVNGTNADYRELLDRMYALYDVWYLTAPNAHDYIDTATNYLTYEDRTPDFAVLGIKYSTVLQCYYSLNTVISTENYLSRSAADQNNYIYVGNDQFAQKVSASNNSAAYTYLKKWKTYYANPCEDFVSYWYRVPYAPIYG